MEEPLKTFASRKAELSLEDGVVLWGARVVVPRKGRQQVLEELHDRHPGPVSCRVMIDNGLTWRHYDQLCPCYLPGLDSQLAYREHLHQEPDVHYGPPKALASKEPIAQNIESAGPMQTAVSPSAP